MTRHLNYYFYNYPFKKKQTNKTNKLQISNITLPKFEKKIGISIHNLKKKILPVR